MREAIEQFREAIRAAGLTPPDEIEVDGKLRRFASNGKKSDDAGWYLLHGDGIPAGSFGDWRTGFSQTWRADIGRALTPAEEAEHRAKVETMRRERDATITRDRAEAASKAGVIWNIAKPASADHAYLQAKGIKPNGARLHGDALVIPMRGGGQIHSLQFIGPDGGKRFLTGGRVTGCYFSIGNPKGAAAICIAEGFATGATIHEATGYPVAVAFNAGNLGAVAKAMRAKFADLRLILCGDFDKSGTGQAAATDAARAVGGLVTLPDFTPGELAGDKPPSDFNDLAALHGLEAVKRAIANASTPARGEHQPGNDYAPAVDPATEIANPGASKDDDAEIIKRLAAMSPLEYDRNRRDIAKSIGVRPATLDKMVIAERKDNSDDDMGFADIEPWTSPVDPGALLSEISATLRRFIVCQQETADAVALWAAMTWFMDVVQVAPLSAPGPPTTGASRLPRAKSRNAWASTAYRVRRFVSNLKRPRGFGAICSMRRFRATWSLSPFQAQQRHKPAVTRVYMLRIVRHVAATETNPKHGNPCSTRLVAVLRIRAGILAK